MQDFAATIRRAIEKSGKSQNALAQEACVPQQRVNEFMRGKGLNLATANKLAAVLGLELRPGKSRGRQDRPQC